MYKGDGVDHVSAGYIILLLSPVYSAQLLAYACMWLAENSLSPRAVPPAPGLRQHSTNLIV